MVYARALLAACVLITFTAICTVESLRCSPCVSSNCPQIRCESPRTLVDDICHCCKVCGRIDGEVCGGPYSGGAPRCNSVLTCHLDDPNDYNSNGICDVSVSVFEASFC